MRRRDSGTKGEGAPEMWRAMSLVFAEFDPRDRCGALRACLASMLPGGYGTPLYRH